MAEALACAACGTEVAPGLFACPGCHRLVHAETLKSLAASADAAQQAGDLTACLVAWRDALELLPPGSKQYASVSDRIALIGQGVDVRSLPKSPPRATPNGAATEGVAGDQGRPTGHGGGARAGLAGAGAALVFLLTKGKFLLLGLTKASTFLSMLATVGIFWKVFGWPLAVGLVVSIYIHEMGHVYELTRYGIKASAPLFVPGLGAVILMRQVLTDPRQDARVGLAGPIWGLGAALAFCAAGFALDAPLMTAIAQTGALINLFNMLPVWSLDGGRAFRSLSRPQRWLATAAIATAWSVSENPFLMILMLCGAWRAFAEPGAARPDRKALLTYIFLIGALTALTLLPVPV